MTETITVCEPLPPLSQAQAHLVETTDDAMDCLRWLSGKTEIGFDTETTGLDHDTDRARLVQVGDAMDGWAIPFEQNSMLVRDIVKRFEGRYIMHNAPFDTAMMKNAGIIIPEHLVDDTRLMCHVLSSTGPLALKVNCQKYVDQSAGAAQQNLTEALSKRGAWTWADIPIDFEPYWFYAAVDPVLTYRLKQAIYPLVAADAIDSYRLELQVQWVCEAMARKGARVDREYVGKFSAELTDHIAAVEEWCSTYYSVSPGSTDKVVAILSAEGVEFTKFTPGGKPSLDKEVLSAIEHPLASAVLGHRQAVKLSSTYLTTYLTKSERDGRVHPSINSVGGMGKSPFESGGKFGVRTGRTSMSDPNLQNVPIHSKEGKKIRNAFIPSEGCTWLKSDADQIEMRIFAHLAKDSAMIAAFAQADRPGGVDMFLHGTRVMFEDPTIQKSDDRRQYVKNAHYSRLYSAGPEKFAQTARIDVSTAQRFISGLDQMYPGIRRFQVQIDAECRERLMLDGEAYVRSDLTNRKFVADKGRIYAALNYKIQGMAGELLKMKMIELDHAGLLPYMTLTVHDEVDFDVPTDLVPDVTQTIADVVNDDDILDVPLRWTTTAGNSWGECS